MNNMPTDPTINNPEPKDGSSEKIQKIENIEVDDVAVIDEFCSKVSSKSEREKLDAVRSFLKDNLKNALKEGADIPEDVQRRIWDQKTPKKLSQVFQDKYGTCLDWHAAGYVVLNKLGIETVFRSAYIPGGPGHTYLDVKIDNKWEVSDPFAEQYIKDCGGTGGRFQREYYRDSNAEKQ
jgi:hypothetical protein